MKHDAVVIDDYTASKHLKEAYINEDKKYNGNQIIHNDPEDSDDDEDDIEQCMSDLNDDN
jgi:hypothetical protein